jgi:hypothetical protein
MYLNKIEAYLKTFFVYLSVIVLSYYGLIFFIRNFENEKLLILIITYILPALFIFKIYFKSRKIFFTFFILIFLIQFAVYSYFDHRWEHGLFLEQDSLLFLKSWDTVSLNPIQNYFSGHSNGALYLSIVKVFSYILPLPLPELCILVNAFFLLAMMARLQKAIFVRYEINSIWAMKYLAVSPLVHCYEFVALKDIMTMSFIGFFLAILLEKGHSLKLIMFGLAISLNRLLVGIASMAAISPILTIFVIPLMLYAVTGGNILPILSSFLAGGEIDGIIFPLSTIKFILTPLPHTAADIFPSQFPLVFHIPLTLIAILGFIKYSEYKLSKLIIFVILFLLISHFSPGNVRYRLMFEPFLALGFALFMHNRKKIKGPTTQ